MKVDSAQQLLEYQMMTQILQSASKNSETFQFVLEGLSNAMAGDNNELAAAFAQGLSTANKSSTQSSPTSTQSTGSVSTGIEDAVNKASAKYGVDKKLIEAVINQESSYNPNAVSSSGAQGLMQLMPSTASSLGVTDSYDIDQNVDGGTKYLKGLLNQYGQSKELALSAYNAGSNTLKKDGVDSKDKIDRLPFETRNYVSQIMKYYNS